MAAKPDSTELIPAGRLEPYVMDELPDPPAWKWSNFFKMVGPGAMILSLSIGSGEWLMGPANVVLYGAGMMWIVTVSVLLQWAFNMENIRYTMYTGEPSMVGMLRAAPGPGLWVPIWFILTLCSISGGWVLSSSTALTAMILGRMPTAADSGTVRLVGVILTALIVLLMLSGRSVQRTLEVANKWICIFIFSALLILTIIFVPGHVWLSTLKGFFQFGYMPKGIDPFLVGAFAAYAGCGGVGNMAMANWWRDRGLAMGAKVGFISGVIGGKSIAISPHGKVFKPTPDNVKKFNLWYRWAATDQGILFALGALLGMYLCVTFASGIIPAGTKIGGWAVAAYQAKYIAERMGYFGWFLVLWIGFWALWGTQMTQTDAVTRHITEILFRGSKTIQNWAKGDIRKLYYGVLVIVLIWVMSMFFTAMPFWLVQFTANVSGVVFVIASALQFYLYSLMPKEIRPPWWMYVVMAINVLFFGFFATNTILGLFGIRLLG